jgi:hypothetical protein
MKTRKLGKLEVSEMGAGCMSISANYGPPAPRDQGMRGGGGFHAWLTVFSCPPRQSRTFRATLEARQNSANVMWCLPVRCIDHL